MDMIASHHKNLRHGGEFSADCNKNLIQHKEMESAVAIKVQNWLSSDYMSCYFQGTPRRFE